MSRLWRDASFGIRLLWRRPALASIVVIALALGIAANTAVFSIVYATLLAPLPYPDPDRMVMVWSRVRGGKSVVSAGDFLEWRRESEVFRGLNAWTGRSVSLSVSSWPEQVQAVVATPGFFTSAGDPFLLGRDFLPEEGQAGKDRVVILSNRFWRERFGGDPGILGRDIRVDGQPHTVVGVLQAGSADRGQAKLTLPLAFTPDQLNHDVRWLLVVGRMKQGVSLEQANANMEAVTRRLAADHPGSNAGWSASVEPLKNSFLSRDTIAGLWLLLGAVGFVLLIACANVANLLLARGATRQREVAVRASLGAARGRVFAQFLTESVVLAAVGGALGLALAPVLLNAILAHMPPHTLPNEADVRLHVPVLLFTLAASVVSGILAGCAPAWQASRLDLNEMLKDAGRSGIGGGRSGVRRALVAAEFALALTLLGGVALAIHGFTQLMAVDLGFRTERLLTFSLPVPRGRLESAERIDAFYGRLLERIRSLPGVVSVSASTGMPLRGGGFGRTFHVAGQPAGDAAARPTARFSMVTPDYFGTFGIPITRGRAFTADDRAGTVRVAVVNEAFVRRHLPGVDPLKQRVAVEQLIPGSWTLGPPVEWQIVGVAGDVRNGFPAPDSGNDVEIDVPFAQSPWPAAGIAVRTSGEPEGVRTAVAATLRSLDPELPMADVRSMDQVLAETLAGARFGTLLLGSFAGFALLLAALGIYGVTSFSVAQRTHEIGLRMALGAGRGRVVREVLKEGMAAASAGAVAGSLGAYLLGRAMQGLFSAIGPWNPALLGVVALALLAAALLACVVPARRAASVDPMAALREG